MGKCDVVRRPSRRKNPSARSFVRITSRGRDPRGRSPGKDRDVALVRIRTLVDKEIGWRALPMSRSLGVYELPAEKKRPLAPPLKVPGATTFVWFVWGAMTTAALAFAAAYGTEVPINDDWFMVPALA